MQRSSTELPSRAPPSKRGGTGSGRRGGRGVLSVVANPLVVVVLFAGLLLYSSHRFSSLSARHAHLDDIRGGERERPDSQAGSGTGAAAGGAGEGAAAADASRGAAAAAAGAAGLDAAAGGSVQQQHPHRSSWLSAAVMWAEEHHAARIKAKVGGAA